MVLEILKVAQLSRSEYCRREGYDRLSQDYNISRTNFTDRVGRRRYRLVRKKENQNSTK